MIPTCFSNPRTNTSTKMPQSLITCIYQAHLCNIPTYLTLTWSKSLLSHSLTIQAPNSFSITISLLSSLFKSRTGSKFIHLTKHQKTKLYWDFSRAEFPQENSAEPDSSFYIAIVCNSKLIFFLGDKKDELTRRTRLPKSANNSTLLSRREHVFAKKSYITHAEFLGSKHEIVIECRNGVLKVKIDGQMSLVVKRLAWKFRGNERIVMDGVEVEFFWDLYNWVKNGDRDLGKTKGGYGVFGFQIGDGGVLPEMVGPERKLATSLSPAKSCSSVMQWAEESGSECARSSCSSSTTRSCGSGGGFSLLLYAWRKD